MKTASLPWKKLLLSNFSVFYHLYGKALIIGHLKILPFTLILMSNIEYTLQCFPKKKRS